MADRALMRFGWLSLAAALTTMGLKLVAWRITDSVGLLSDALESSVNLVAALLMLVALRVASRPPDATHQYGHEKAELFSAGAEGVMIVVAAALIVFTAVERLLHPRPVERIGIGLAVSLVAAAINLCVAQVLMRRGREHRSLALVADGKHLMTDVWTSAGVLVGVLLVGITGWQRLDPLIALGVGVNIVVTGGRLVWRSMDGLMDPPLVADDLAALRGVIARYEADGTRFHALRTRVAGHRRFVDVHVLVPGAWPIVQGHDLVERFARDLDDVLPGVDVHTHLEPVEDPASYEDP